VTAFDHTPHSEVAFAAEQPVLICLSFVSCLFLANRFHHSYLRKNIISAQHAAAISTNVGRRTQGAFLSGLPKIPSEKEKTASKMDR
jgi:hypothetical protein